MAALPELNAESFSVEIEGVGTFYEGFKSYRINSNYTTPTDAWSFVVYSDDDAAGLRQRWRPWQPVRLYVSGACQVIGRIDRIKGVGPGSAALMVSGRDYLADLVDATMDPTFQLSQEMNLGEAVLEICKPWGITGVLSDGGLTRNIRTGKQPTRPAPEDLEQVKLEDFKAEENQGVMEFLNKLVSRHGFTIQPAGTRDTILVVRPQYDQPPLYDLSRPGNILEGTADRNYTEVPTVTLGRGRAGGGKHQVGGTRSEFPTFSEGAPSRIGTLTEVLAITTADNNIAVTREKRFDPKRGDNTLYGYDPPIYKPLFFRDKDSRNGAQVERSVKRMLAEKLRDTLLYEVSARGHTETKSGAIWSVDTIVRVDDGVEDVRENLWILERTLANDGTGDGPRTDMACVRPESYVY
jgi:prophage tail gpP-like protein